MKKPRNKFVYEGEDIVEYKQTSFRLPVSQVEQLETWADELKEGKRKRGSVNDLLQHIIDWALEHKGGVK